MCRIGFFVTLVFAGLCIQLWAQEPEVRPVETYLNLDADFGKYRDQGEEKYFDSIAFPVLEKYHMLMSPAWYAYQARVWARDLRKGKSGPEGWLYLFRALRHAGKTEAADSVRRYLSTAPQSWAARIVNWYALPPSKRNLREFEALFAEAPVSARVHLIPEYLNVLDAQCRLRSRDSLFGVWEKSGEWPQELVYYGYNMVQTLVPNAVLFSDGPFETSAILKIQSQDVRQDVAVINLHLLSYREYQTCLAQRLQLKIPSPLPEDPGLAIQKIVNANPTKIFYLTQNTAKTHFKTLGLPLYCEGLAYRLSKPSYSTFYRLMDNLQGNYNLRYLQDSLSHNIFNKFRAPSFNMAYVAPMLQIFDLYTYRDEKDKAEQWFEKALQVAKKCGHEDVVHMHRLFWERQGKEDENPHKIRH
ncbi:MAG: hypothetical protein N2050_08895 [Flavobacteriales bacterium]|nr:hypothetical protein [Flavobacteriales bacterium]